MLFNMLKKLINADTQSQVEIEKRLNVFFAFNQISEDEYKSLMSLLQERHN